jgi:hypothetical protein
VYSGGTPSIAVTFARESTAPGTEETSLAKRGSASTVRTSAWRVTNQVALPST